MSLGAFSTLGQSHHAKRKARLVEVSRSLASIFVPAAATAGGSSGSTVGAPTAVPGSAGGPGAVATPEEIQSAELLRSLVAAYRGDAGRAPRKPTAPRVEVPGITLTIASAYRPMATSAEVREMLLAVLILRSIELERSAESPPAKKRRVQQSEKSGDVPRPLDNRCHMQPTRPATRQPLFRLPCPDASLQRCLQIFCAGFFTLDAAPGKQSEGPPLQLPCLLALVDSCIPCSTPDSSAQPRWLTGLPPSLARDILRNASLSWVRHVLRAWQRDHIVLLTDATGNPIDFSQKPSTGSDSAIGDLQSLDEDRAGGEHGLVLKSVSPSRLTQLLVQKLRDLGLQAKRPAAAAGETAAGFPRVAGLMGGPHRGGIGGPGGPPAVPPPPPSGPPRPQDGLSKNVLQMLRILEEDTFLPSHLEELGAGHPRMLDEPVGAKGPAAGCWKALLARETACDMITRSFLIRETGDPEFAVLRYCVNTNCLRRAQCKYLHYKRMPQAHTDVNLGDCSYLDTCRHIFTCKFVHYAMDLTQVERDAALRLKHRTVFMNQYDVLERSAESLQLIDESPPDGTIPDGKELWLEKGVFRVMGRTAPTPPQWIRCDLRSLDLSVFRGSVSVVMADPPWDIRMDLPYGTMTDHEMKHLRVDLIQDEGLLFLWVTGRAMEIARECMTIWGYQRVDEIVWVKTNHLHRIIRTGRTGHWLNHSKEHCLVGIKGNPKIFKNVDCDVIVSEVRETSRKPDEIYRIIERMCPQGLKLELFGRQHNLRQNWITLGNQLDGVQLHTSQIVKKFREHRQGMRQVKLEEARRLELAAAATRAVQPSA